MKQAIYIFLICLLTALPLAAQDDTCPYLECCYTSQAKFNALNKDKVNQDEWALRIAKDCAEFYSVWYRTHKSLKDSIFGSGGSLEDWYAAREKVLCPPSTNSEALYKDYPAQGKLVYVRKIFSTLYQYEETYERPAWQVKTEKKDIMGYACQKATADFRGRTWIAWFAPEVPVMEGPWKLHGLPGLILEAYDAEDDYHYTCIELKRLQGEKPIRVPQKKYVKCDRKELDKLLSTYENNPNDYMKLQGLPMAYKVQSDGTLTTKLYDACSTIPSNANSL